MWDLTELWLKEWALYLTLYLLILECFKVPKLSLWAMCQNHCSFCCIDKPAQFSITSANTCPYHLLQYLFFTSLPQWTEKLSRASSQFRKLWMLCGLCWRQLAQLSWECMRVNAMSSKVTKSRARGKVEQYLCHVSWTLWPLPGWGCRLPVCPQENWRPECLHPNTHNTQRQRENSSPTTLYGHRIK